MLQKQTTHQLEGEGGNDFLNGRGGNNILAGGSNKRYLVDDLGDAIAENAGEGNGTDQRMYLDTGSGLELIATVKDNERSKFPESSKIFM